MREMNEGLAENGAGMRETITYRKVQERCQETGKYERGRFAG